MQTLAALEPRVQVFSQAASLSWCQSSAASTQNRGARTTETQEKEKGVTRYGGRGLELGLRGEREEEEEDGEHPSSTKSPTAYRHTSLHTDTYIHRG